MRREHLINFCNTIQDKTIKFLTSDFTFIYELISQNKIYENDFLYFDPPYLISNTTYNNLWNSTKDEELLNLLDVLNLLNIKWALSNVFESKGKTNKKLIEWSKKYNVHYLSMNYSNSNYQRKSNKKDIEVLITNYEI